MPPKMSRGDELDMLARHLYTKNLAQQGNPLPFIRFQWGSMLEIQNRPEACADKDGRHKSCPQCYEADWFAKRLTRAHETDLRLDDFQVEICEHMFRPDITEIFIKGATAPGKGFIVALLINVWFDIWDDARVVITSSDFAHAKNTLFAEVVNLRRQMRLPGPNTKRPARIAAEDIKHSEKRLIRVANPEKGEGFSGAHGGHTLFCFDEGSGVPDDLYDNATKQSRMVLALSNPRMMTGWFHDGYPLDDPDTTKVIPTRLGKRLCVTIGGAECFNVRNKCLARPVAPMGGLKLWENMPGKQEYKEGELIPENVYAYLKPGIPSQVDYARFLANCADPDPIKVAWSAHGKFPSEDADFQVILPSWLKRHEDAWRDREDRNDPVPVTAFGFDVAKSTTGDDSVLAAGGDFGCRALHVTKTSDAMEAVGWVLRIAKDLYGIDLTDGDVPIAVDCVGLGGPVADRLAELGCNVVKIVGSMSPDVRKEIYLNKRTECYAELGDRLSPDGQHDEPWCLPPDPRLREELVAPEKIYRSDGVKYGLTPKDKTPSMKKQQVQDNRKTIREKIGRSPDRADAVTYLYAAVRDYVSDEPPAAQFTLFGGEPGPVTVTVPPMYLVDSNGDLVYQGPKPEQAAADYEALELPEDLEDFLKIRCPI